MVIKLAS